MDLHESTTLGKTTSYPEKYDAGLLTPIPRQASRNPLGLTGTLPFNGVDIWNAFELSWLLPSGKPEVAMAEIRVDCSSENIIESKSLKLYLNSFNQTIFTRSQAVVDRMEKDLVAAAKGNVTVKLVSASELAARSPWLDSACIDGLDVECKDYSPTPELLVTEKNAPVVSETLCSHLLKSNCPVTGQPDWATVYIRYTGRKISQEGLLRYIVSLRGHQDFHENCVESMFMDLKRQCRPGELAVYARYTRRGGLDINPLRSNFPVPEDNFKLPRQ